MTEAPTTVSDTTLYPDTLKQRDYWVTWALDDEGRKRPRAPWLVGHSAPCKWSATLDDEDRPETDFETAKRWADLAAHELGRGYTLPESDPEDTLDLGLLLPDERPPPEERVLLVDWDNVRDPETGATHPLAAAFLKRGNTYAELSQSGTGAHQFPLGELPNRRKIIVEIDDEPWMGCDELPQVEIYDCRRHVAMTGQHIDGTPEDLAPDQNLVDAVLDQFVDDTGRDDGTAAAYGGYEVDPDADYPPCYHATLQAREDPPDHLANWELIGYTTILGAAHGRSNADILDDLRAHPAPPYGFDPNREPNEVARLAPQVRSGDRHPPNARTLIQLGILPGPDACDCPIHGNDGEADADPIAVLPNSPRVQAATNGWNWNAVDTDAADAPTQEDVYNRVTEAITDAMRRQDQVVVDAIMGGGKTFNTFAAAKERDEPLAYFAPRRDLYDQAAVYAADNGFDRDDEVFVLPTAERDCPTFQGKHGEEWEHRVKTLYRRGATPKAIHNLLGDDMPCAPECPYEAKCKIDPDEYEVVIGHYKHGHLPHATKGRHAVFDENPTDTFTTRVAGRALIRGVNAFLALEDSPPFDTFTNLLEHRRSDEGRREAALAWFETFDFEPDEQNVVRFENEGYHAYAPHAVYTILTAEPLDEDGYAFEKASLPGLDNEGLFFTTDDQYDQYFVELQTPPELTYAKSVIALDGTPFTHPESDDPEPSEWEKALGRPLNHRQVLTDAEREAFLAHTQGHTYVQTSPDIRPYSSGKWNDKQRDAALLAAVTNAYGDGDPPVVFTSYKVRKQYEDEFTDAGLAADFDHPQNIRGSNEYATHRFAVQLGSSHHGDHELARRAAWLDEPVAPEGKGIDRDYGPVGNEVLKQMRECQVAQNVLRVGRDGNGAMVVLDTAAYPDWLPVEDGVGDVSLWSPTEQQVRDAFSAIRESEGKRATTGGVTTADLADHSAVDGGESAVRKACRRHADRGLLEKRADTDDGRRARWVDEGLGDLDSVAAAEVDLPDLDVDDEDEGGEVAARSHMGLYYTQPSRNPSPDQPSKAPAADAPEDGTATGGDPPPDEAD